MTEPLTLEALHALVNAVTKTDVTPLRRRAYYATRAALLTALRSLWEDRERLDWIEANAAHADADEEWDDTSQTWVQVYEVFNGATCAHHSARTLRSAIDAAREKP